MSQPRISDGHPLIGEIIVVIDESSPPNTSGGVACVVTAAAMLALSMVEASLSEFSSPAATDRSTGREKDPRREIGCLALPPTVASWPSLSTHMSHERASWPRGERCSVR